MKVVKPFDMLDGTPCPQCGSTQWIVDGDGKDHWWLLCAGDLADGRRFCVETRDLPPDVEVVRPPRSPR